MGLIVCFFLGATSIGKEDHYERRLRYASRRKSTRRHMAVHRVEMPKACLEGGIALAIHAVLPTLAQPEPEPLEERKAALARLLRKTAPGLQLNEHLAEPGDVVFRHAC
jgi:hypothetical protein